MTQRLRPESAPGQNRWTISKAREALNGGHLTLLSNRSSSPSRGLKSKTHRHEHSYSAGDCLQPMGDRVSNYAMFVDYDNVAIAIENRAKLAGIPVAVADAVVRILSNVKENLETPVKGAAWGG